MVAGESRGFAPGTYRGAGQGKYGPIEVEVDVGRDTLEDIRVVAHQESERCASVALRYLPLKMVDAQEVAVDAVSGATFTSRGIVEAVEAALAAAGGDATCLRAGRSGVVPQAMAPGMYVASAVGRWAPGTVDGARFGAAADPVPVTVRVTVGEGAIEDVRILACTDNDHFVQPVADRVVPAIVEQQSILVDAVTGATCTSAAVLKATAACLEEAGADMRGFLSTRPRSVAEEWTSCDVCVVGGGHAGTVAALMALEQGADVLIVEKAGRIGGRGFCPSGVSAAGAAVEREAGATLTADDLYRQLYRETGGRANNLLVRAIAEDSGPMVDWLVAHGFHADPPRPDAREDEAFMCDFGRGQEKFQRLYDDYLLPGGALVMTETRALELRQDERGAVIGVEAQRQDGTRVHVACGAVVVAAGGFSGSPALLRRLCHSDSFYDRGLTTQCSGEGVLMCERAGAQLGPEIMPHMQEYLANPVCNFTDNLIKYLSYAGFLTVNREGRRFMNECLNVEDAMGSGCASLRVQGGAYYYLISQDQVDAIRERGVGGYFDGRLGDYLSKSVASRALVPIPNLQESLDEAVAKGQAWRGESAEELAALVGFPDPAVFVATLARYNELCHRGADEDFGKISPLMNEHAMPLYAIRSVIPIMGTLGGVRVNERLEALGRDGAPILGLYVAGQEGSGFYTYPYYSTRCITTTYAYCSGRIAGRNAAGYATSR